MSAGEWHPINDTTGLWVDGYPSSVTVPSWQPSIGHPLPFCGQNRFIPTEPSYEELLRRIEALEQELQFLKQAKGNDAS